jgi:osmotically-inducible protein OsmY
MTLTTSTRAFLATFTLAVALAGCGPKDADIQAEADKVLAASPGVTVSVASGVATLAGEVADDAAKASAEAAVKAVKGVKSVVDNVTVKPPPPPVVISADDSLKTNVMAALKDYAGLSADVKDGVVTLTGEVKRADLTKVMQALSGLHPKKIENKATVQK